MSDLYARLKGRDRGVVLCGYCSRPIGSVGTRAASGTQPGQRVFFFVPGLRPDPEGVYRPTANARYLVARGLNPAFRRVPNQGQGLVHPGLPVPVLPVRAACQYCGTLQTIDAERLGIAQR